MYEEIMSNTSASPPTDPTTQKQLINTTPTPSSNPPPHPTSTFEVGAWAARAALDIITLTALGRDFCAIQNASSPLAAVYSRVVEPTLGHMIIAILRYLPPLVHRRGAPHPIQPRPGGRHAHDPRRVSGGMRIRR